MEDQRSFPWQNMKSKRNSGESYKNYDRKKTDGHFDRTDSRWKNSLVHRACKKNQRIDHLRRLHAGIPAYGYRLCKGDAGGDEWCQTLPDRWIWTGWRVSCGKICGACERAFGGNLCRGKNSDHCRRHRILYSGTSLWYWLYRAGVWWGIPGRIRTACGRKRCTLSAQHAAWSRSGVRRCHSCQ